MIEGVWVFVGAACCASTFTVPYSWESPGVCPEVNGKVETMEDPASVGLQECKVRQGLRDEVLVMRNKEASLLFSVNCQDVRGGVWLFSMNVAQKGFGDVCFYECDKRKFAKVDIGNATVAIHELGDFNLWSQVHKIQYDFDEESVTVRRGLGYIGGGDRRELFVSATIAYNDIKTIDIGCGTGRLSWSAGPFNGLKRLSATTTIRTLCLDTTKECVPLDAGERR